MEKIRILLVDNHRMVLAGLKQMLDRVPDFEVSGEALDGRQALHLMSQAPSDVVMMDVAMKGLNGIEATRRIKRCFPQSRVIGLSYYGHREIIDRMFHAGADGYVIKECAACELIEAVRSVLSGRIHLCPRAAAVMAQKRKPLSDKRCGLSSPPPLTSREREILQCVAEGKSTKEISGILYLSEYTVENHRRNIVRKLKLRNLAALTKYALLQGLTPLMY